MPGKDAFVALDEISRFHPDERSRPWMRLHAKTKAELDSDGSPWSAAQVREFHDSQERTPANNRELFDLAVKRLLDLRSDLEEGDSSDAPVLSRAKDEAQVRTYIGNWCRRTAHGRYSLPQEEELADAKRPDLRWHGVGFDAPVPVELKLADNWTGPKLFERLEVQLCGDYLRDPRSSRGIFLLVSRGEKANWELPESGQLVGFDGLAVALRERWNALSTRLPGVDEIQVIQIELQKRLSPSTPAVASTATR